MINDTCIFDFEKCEIKREDSGKLVGTIVISLGNLYILENEEKCYVSQTDNGRFLL